ncbi:hypothetical protein [Devosia neptuniae]|uniref:hypothetical protein n=1 Tax=Devosia neptuniae TaxID=191302 RepID=UPI0022AEF20F|nr:hypothetical protein [Devosia neptuniae]MCZ4346445.1 hypothetical protein [Devosia neptuniae]
MVPILLFLILLWPIFAIFGGTLLVVLGSHLHIVIPTVLISVVYLAILAPIAKRNNIKLGGKIGEALDPSKPIGHEFQKLTKGQEADPSASVSIFTTPDKWKPVPRDRGKSDG